MKSQVRNRPLEAPIKASARLALEVQSGLALPAYHFRGPLLAQTAQEQGGFALMVPARRQAFQLPMAMATFFGVTCELNSTESHHFHPHQVEVYVVMKGVVRMLTWLGFNHKEFVLRAGDALVVPPGTCHHLTDWVEPGLVYVFRSPNDIAGEPAKIACNESAHCRPPNAV